MQFMRVSTKVVVVATSSPLASHIIKESAARPQQVIISKSRKMQIYAGPRKNNGQLTNKKKKIKKPGWLNKKNTMHLQTRMTCEI